MNINAYVNRPYNFCWNSQRLSFYILLNPSQQSRFIASQAFQLIDRMIETRGNRTNAPKDQKHKQIEMRP
jgi:hypothetical protein